MASVRATVHVARPMVAPISQFLVHVVYTSIACALTAGFFAIAVHALPQTPRAMSFEATVSTLGTLVVNYFHALVARACHRDAMRTQMFHSAPLMHVARILALVA